MNPRRAIFLSCALLLCVAPLTAQTPVKSDSVVSYKRTADGVELQTQHGTLQIQLCTESMAHVVFRPPKSEEHSKPWIVKTAWPAVSFTLKEDPNHLVILSTRQLRVTVERDS